MPYSPAECAKYLLETAPRLFQSFLTLVLGELVDLVKDYEHVVHQDFADDQAFRRLCLDSLRNINDQHHEVNDLCSSDDGSNQRCMAWTIYQRKLQSIKFGTTTGLKMLREGDRERAKAKIQSYPAFLTLRMLV